jgi:16S rRNA (cytidine1402-2'-O)-methyltransferase
MESGLYVVATPIGNLGDMVPRAVEILQSVDIIAAEDTRHSGILLQHFGITTPTFAYHDHSNEASIRRIANCIEGGGSVALISDAGTPLISDPGYRLLRYAHEQGWKLIPIPGASAVVAALSVAGLATDRFRFEGFLPAKQAARRTRLQALAQEPVTLVFYEAPHRLLESLIDMRDTMGGDRLVVVARELTKTFETLLRAPLAELVEQVAADPNQCRGEIVVLVEAGAARDSEMSAELEQLLLLLAQELPPKKAAAVVAKAFGLRKKELYQYLVNR